MHRLASCATTGDAVTLFAETDVVVALVPSPWRDGGRPAGECDGTVAATSVRTAETGLEPLGWPSGGVAYPDIRPYFEGQRVEERR
jgi:hypothetical protein